MTTSIAALTHSPCVQVPLLDDDDLSTHWIFDTLTKRSLVHRLFTNMSGSVVCNGTQSSSKKRKASATIPKRKAKAKAKAKSAANPTGEPALEPEDGINSTTVSCHEGVRQKVWLDDLMRCVNHVISSLQSREHFRQISADDFTMLKKELVKIGLVFALKGTYLLPSSDGRAGKVYRKWSSLRPALQAYAVAQLVKAGLF